LELLDNKSQVLKRFEPTAFAKFSRDGFTSDNPKITATYNETSSVIDILYLGAVDGVSVRLAASDPAARGCSVELP
jgi:hypothetical protein